MKRRLIVGAGIATFAAGATLGGMAIAGGDASREAGRTIVAEPMVAAKAGAVTRAGSGKVIQTFYVGERIVPDNGSGLVVNPKCPRGKGNAIGGGASTDLGIDLSYLSQLNPETLRTSPRGYWVGVDDNSGADGAGAFVEVYCAQGLSVRK